LSANDLSARTVEVSSYADRHLVPVTGLSADTTYFVKVIAADKNGRTVESTILMKKTKAQ
jgi:hypothetical protein